MGNESEEKDRPLHPHEKQPQNYVHAFVHIYGFQAHEANDVLH